MIEHLPSKQNVVGLSPITRFYRKKQIMNNRLWILRPAGDLEAKNLWTPWYDKAFGFVVRAADEKEARVLASKEAGDEYDRYSGEDEVNPWLEEKYSTCQELLLDGSAEVVIRDFASA